MSELFRERIDSARAFITTRTLEIRNSHLIFLCLVERIGFYVKKQKCPTGIAAVQVLESPNIFHPEEKPPSMG